MSSPWPCKLLHHVAVHVLLSVSRHGRADRGGASRGDAQQSSTNQREATVGEQKVAKHTLSEVARTSN
eukprot:5794923-Pyramimonas_sp.AAC.1